MRVAVSCLFAALLFAPLTATAQTIGTFRWQLAPYGSVMNITVTQRGAVYELIGFETQCSNLSLPVSGVGVPQANGQIFLGMTSINENGRGLHTRAYVNPTTFSGSWSDNAGNSNQNFVFNPGTTCPNGPRTGPSTPDAPAPTGGRQ